MDDKNFQLAQQLINPSYIRLGKNSINKRQKIMKQLLSQRQLPEQALDDLTIKYFLDTFALMDSNNFDHKIGVGQRQSRIFSNLVKQRHFHMGHGIGRSGDVVANQPKAAGSSLILQLTRYLTVSALKELNYEFVSDVLVLPLATGMSISLSLLTLASERPERKYVIWSRIDQKTCLKAIQTANLTPIVIQLKKSGQSLTTDLQAVRDKIKEIGSQKILAVLSTTSCFAPRVPDDVEQMSIIAKQFKIFHVVNNAYGIWCSKIANKIKQGLRKGQCTIVVQSTDKNFLVPVGGSIIFVKQQRILQKISSQYPGRASGSPILDMFITLLSMGKSTLRQLKKQRKESYQKMLRSGQQFSKRHNFKILSTPLNTISIGMSLKPLLQQMSSKQLTQLGSILYSKRVMGHRVIVSTTKQTKIGKFIFKNYGSHSEDYQFLPYITFACAVGTRKADVQVFFKRLEEAVKELRKNVEKQKKKRALKQQTEKQPQLEPQAQLVQQNQMERQAQLGQQTFNRQKQSQLLNTHGNQKKQVNNCEKVQSGKQDKRLQKQQPGSIVQGKSGQNVHQMQINYGIP